MATWQSKLTKAELKHIKDTTNNCTLKEFQTNLKWHKIWDDKNPTGPLACSECNHIANKLGIVTINREVSNV